jgi:hypothetical protein
MKKLLKNIKDAWVEFWNQLGSDPTDDEDYA